MRLPGGSVAALSALVTVRAPVGGLASGWFQADALPAGVPSLAGKRRQPRGLRGPPWVLCALAMKSPTTESYETIAINFSGQLLLSRAVLAELLRPPPAAAPPPPPAGGLDKVDKEGDLPRLAYSMKETAQILGMSYATVFRLVQRGLLRTIPAIRHKLIPRKEVERFLNTATAAFE